jgi:hypothetical protein
LNPGRLPPLLPLLLATSQSGVEPVTARGLRQETHTTYTIMPATAVLQQGCMARLHQDVPPSLPLGMFPPNLWCNSKVNPGVSHDTTRSTQLHKT